MIRKVSCPTCGRQVEWKETSTWRPFCSERCKLIDLGEWASESYRIGNDDASPPDSPDEVTRKRE